MLFERDVVTGPLPSVVPGRLKTLASAVAEITRDIYHRIPVLVREADPERGLAKENPWAVSFLPRFHMSADSNLFRTRAQLDQIGARLEGNVFVKGDER